MVLTAGADVAGDPSLSLRLAAVAAEHNLPIARDALNLLGRRAPRPPVPWPDDLRGALVRCWPPAAAIAALEALDQRQLLERYLPEWAAVRNKPQRNPYHRFTVDRHLLEATANAATMAHRVPGPTCCCSAPSSTTSARGSPATTPRWAWWWRPTSPPGWACPPRTWPPS